MSLAPHISHYIVFKQYKTSEISGPTNPLTELLH